MLDNPDFDGQIDYAPYIDVDKAGNWKFNEFMSGNFTWRHTVSHIFLVPYWGLILFWTDIYMADPTTEGTMYCPITLGADKTTVSVATGHVEYYPLYFSPRDVHNTVWHVHQNAVVPIGFLAILKSTWTCWLRWTLTMSYNVLGDWKYDDDPLFCKFKCQLYHTTLTTILKPLHPGITKPVVQCCPDGHYWRVIYDLVGFIADYPEQVVLAGTVSGWCPRYVFMVLP